MIGTFLTGSAGLSVHRCLLDGSVNLLMFSGASACENHDENCCSTRVFMIDDPVVSAQDLLSEGFPDIPEQELFYTEGVTGDLLKASDCLSIYSWFKPPLEVSVYPGAHLVPLRL
jgi:hypothetical protein